jgi:hypothetical protein
MTDTMDTAAPDLSEAGAGASDTVVSAKDLYCIIHVTDPKSIVKSNKLIRQYTLQDTE